MTCKIQYMYTPIQSTTLTDLIPHYVALYQTSMNNAYNTPPSTVWSICWSMTNVYFVLYSNIWDISCTSVSLIMLYFRFHEIA